MLLGGLPDASMFLKSVYGSVFAPAFRKEVSSLTQA